MYLIDFTVAMVNLRASSSDEADSPASSGIPLNIINKYVGLTFFIFNEDGKDPVADNPQRRWTTIKNLLHPQSAPSHVPSNDTGVHFSDIVVTFFMEKIADFKT